MISNQCELPNKPLMGARVSLRNVSSFVLSTLRLWLDCQRIFFKLHGIRCEFSVARSEDCWLKGKRFMNLQSDRAYFSSSFLHPGVATNGRLTPVANFLLENIHCQVSLLSQLTHRRPSWLSTEMLQQPIRCSAVRNRQRSSVALCFTRHRLMLNGQHLCSTFSTYIVPLYSKGHIFIIHFNEQHFLYRTSGFSILPKDTLGWGLETPGIKPPAIRLADNPWHGRWGGEAPTNPLWSNQPWSSQHLQWSWMQLE